MTRKKYERSKDHYDTAEEAWNDIEERSDLVDSFDQYLDRDHGGNKWTFFVEIEEE